MAMLPYSDDNMLGPYKIVRKLGEGGMGTVYLAFDEQLARHVAIKVLRMDAEHAGSASAAMAKRFLREAQSAAKLNHPNVVTIYTVGQQGAGATARPYLVMEFLEAGSLADQLHRSGPLGWREAAAVLSDALLGLAAAHKAGIVHRDIKPANLMRSAEGAGHGGVKLVDFGLARVVYGPMDAEITFPGAFVGSPSYASPEQIAAGRIDARSDLYSLAATAYALLTGQPPFVDDDPAEIMRRHAMDAFPDVRELSPDVPEEWARVLERASCKDPQERYTGAMEMHAALTQVTALPDAVKSATPTRRMPRSSKATESLAILESQLAAAQESRDESTQLSTLRSLYGLYNQLDRPEQARTAFRQALALHVKMSQPRFAN